MRVCSEAGWWAGLVGLGAVTLFLLFGPGAGWRYESPLAVFWIVTIAASMCTVAAAALLWSAHRRDLAEAGIMGTGLMVLSLLAVVHGLTAPTVVYGPNTAVDVSGFAGLPLGLVAMVPLLAMPYGPRRAIGRRWRMWAAAWMISTIGLGAVLLVWPNLISAPGRTSPSTWAVVAFSVTGAIWLSRVQLRLYGIGRRASTFAAAIGLLVLGASSLVWISDAPFSSGWWLVHALDILGVLTAIVAVAMSHRLRRPIADALEPITALDPLRTLELGLAPIVHQFVAALDAKDSITRDHVVRTATLSIHVGQRLGLVPYQLRCLGLGALLHDIGKLVTPSAILKKPSQLDVEEYRRIQQHPADGAEMLASVPSLADAAPIVRGHHERIDGTGYPDKLTGNQIPLGARIVATCDSFDAMANTRQYRTGMSPDLAVSILKEHSGSQWDPAIVEILADLITTKGVPTPALDSVGTRTVANGPPEPSETPSACDDALPTARPPTPPDQ